MRTCYFRIVGCALASALVLCGAAGHAASDPQALGLRRMFYAVDEAPGERGSISVYDIDAGHRLIKTIKTITDARDVRGVAASAVDGKLYVSYVDRSRTGRVQRLDLGSDRVDWDKPIPPGVDRLAVDPDGRLLYVPTGENLTAGFINVVDAATGDVVRRVRFSQSSHDAQYPVAGPLFQETKAEDGSGRYLYSIDPRSWRASRNGPFADIVGPYAVDSASRHVAVNVTNLWGMQVADLATGHIVTARIPDPPPRSVGLLHGIGWTPDQSEVWQSSAATDGHVYVWDMRDPTRPVLKRRLPLRSGHGAHWLTFTIAGDYAYVAPRKNTADGTEVFDARNHVSVGVIHSSEDMLEIDFVNGRVSRVGDQYGIGRR